MYSRMIGASAAASSSQRRIELRVEGRHRVADAVDGGVAGCPEGEYAGRKTAIASSSPPTAATISEVLMRRKSIGSGHPTSC